MSQKEAWTLRQKIVGVLLRQARLNAGKTQKDCGQVLGLSSGAISAMEYGDRTISLPELEMLAYYFDVPLDQLLNGDGAGPGRRPVEDLPSQELLTLRHRIIGALLRQARQAHDLTQAEVAKRLGVSAGRISQYELGERPIPLAELETLAELLETPLTTFLDEGVGPVGEQQRLEREWQQFTELSSEMRSFVTEPTNLRYLELAQSLSGVPAERLRNIAASLLEITL